MKKLLLFLLLIFAVAAQAQDYIVYTNGDKLKVKYIDKTSTHIRYQPFGVKTAPLKSIARAGVAKIIFQDSSELIIDQSIIEEKPIPKYEVPTPRVVEPQPIYQNRDNGYNARPQQDSYYREPTSLAKELPPVLTVMGGAVFRQGMVLQPLQVGTVLIDNANALNTYNQGRSKLKSGRTFSILGLVLSGLGLLTTVAEAGEGYSSGGGLVLAAGGLGLAIPGAILKNSGKQHIAGAINLYNSERGKRTGFIISPIIKTNGVGICMRF